MDISFTKFAVFFQDLFGVFFTDSLEKFNFFQRNRKMTAKDWFFTLLEWITQDKPTLSSLSNLFAGNGINISPQALSKKFNMKCSHFLLEIVNKIIENLIVESNAKAPALLSLFSGVYLADCTLCQLSHETKELFPGVGGNDENVNVSELKIFLRIEATTGVIESFSLGSGRTSDHTFYSKTKPLPRNSLELADMGFGSQKRMLDNLKNKVDFICRVQSQSILYYDNQRYSISEFLNQQDGDEVDVLIQFGANQVPCRLVGRKVSEEVAKRKLDQVTRKAKKSGRKVSQAQRIVSHWQFYITSIDSSRCSLDEIITLYSVRWQIELIFKFWKSCMNLNKSKGKTTARVLCEKLLKMIYILIYHGHEILADIGPVSDVSHVAVHDRYKTKFHKLLDALRKGYSTNTISKRIKEAVCFMRGTRTRNKRVKNRNLHDKLQNRQTNQTIIATS